MSRQPFTFAPGDWCSALNVDLGISTGFPDCTNITFTAPTYIHVPRVDPPDANPGPFCPCFPTADCTWKGTYRSTYSVGHTSELTFNIKMIPLTADCCSPDMGLQFTLDIPCLPFTINSTVAMTAGTNPRFDVTKVLGTCQFDFNLDIPCVPFTIEVSNLTAEPTDEPDIPRLSVSKLPGTCKFKMNLRSPPAGVAELEVCLYEHGEGVKFVTCCDGCGCIALDCTVVRKSKGTVQLNLIHHVNLIIPLLAKLADYTEAVCNEKLSAAHTMVYDPWGAQVVWTGADNAPGKGTEKYCKEPVSEPPPAP